MTAHQVLAVLRRRWYVVLIVLVLTAGVAFALPRQPGVWYSRVDVVFLVPNNPKLTGNALEGKNASLINFTAAIERQVNGSAQQIKLSSPDATLYGAGVERGYIVTLPSQGGQWNLSFSQSVLRVEVVDTTEQATAAVATDLVSRIERAATFTQAQLDIPPSQLVRTEVNPKVPVVGFVPGSRKRAVAVVGLIGMGGAVAAALQVDRVARRRRLGRAPALAQVGA